jgi:hypothetical protein
MTEANQMLGLERLGRIQEQREIGRRAFAEDGSRDFDRIAHGLDVKRNTAGAERSEARRPGLWLLDRPDLRKK